jgi:hypothetical protein
MRKPNRTILISSAAALVIGLTGTAALASTGSHPAAPATKTWSVSLSNSTLGAGLVGPAVITDTVTGAHIRCAGSIDYTVTKGGMGLKGTLATVNTQFNNCTLDGTAVTLTESGSWNLTGNSFSPSTNLGVTTGAWRDVDLSFSSSSCSGNLDGTAANANDGVLTFQYYNNPGWFIVRKWGGNLHAYAISGCTGLFSTGDPITVSATSSLGSVTLLITSP